MSIIVSSAPPVWPLYYRYSPRGVIISFLPLLPVGMGDLPCEPENKTFARSRTFAEPVSRCSLTWYGSKKGGHKARLYNFRWRARPKTRTLSLAITRDRYERSPFKPPGPVNVRARARSLARRWLFCAALCVLFERPNVLQQGCIGATGVRGVYVLGAGI